MCLDKYIWQYRVTKLAEVRHSRMFSEVSCQSRGCLDVGSAVIRTHVRQRGTRLMWPFSCISSR
jgi:hypothetical protein